MVAQATFIAKAFLRAKYHHTEYITAKFMEANKHHALTMQRKKRRDVMMKNQQVSFKIAIVGFGSIGSLLLEALIADTFQCSDIIVVSRRKEIDLSCIPNLPKYSRVTVTQNLQVALRECDLIFLCVLPSQLQYLDFSLENELTQDTSTNVLEELLHRKVASPSHHIQNSTCPITKRNTTVFISFISGVPRQKIIQTVHSDLVITLQLSNKQKSKLQFSQITNIRNNVKEVLQNALFVTFSSPHTSIEDDTLFTFETRSDLQNNMTPQTPRSQQNDNARSGTTKLKSCNLWIREQLFPTMLSYITLYLQYHHNVNISIQHAVAMAIDQSIGYHVSTKTIENIWKRNQESFSIYNGLDFWVQPSIINELMLLEIKRQIEKKKNLEMKESNKYNDYLENQGKRFVSFDSNVGVMESNGTFASTPLSLDDLNEEESLQTQASILNKRTLSAYISAIKDIDDHPEKVFVDLPESATNDSAFAMADAFIQREFLNFYQELVYLSKA